MSYNRNKALTKAQKLFQKGKPDRAISEYMRIVENDPSDVRTWLKIGDLHAELGNIDLATETYQKVGELYVNDGFYLKAVAVYKQILKLDPRLISVYVRLAELYQYLGLTSEAIKRYQIVVRHYEALGLRKESLAILKKMSELEPGNIVNRVIVAELYAKEGHMQTSTEQFQRAVIDLKKRNLRDLARVYEKMEAHNILDTDLQLELIEIYLDVSEPKRALDKLKIFFQSGPKNLKALELLARTFTDLEQREKARLVYTRMINLVNNKGMSEVRERYVAKLRHLTPNASNSFQSDTHITPPGPESAPLEGFSGAMLGLPPN